MVFDLTNNDPPLKHTFTLFPKLLPELQIMIWKEALPEPRVVYIKNADGAEPLFPMHSTALIPAVLHACTESRRITMAAGWCLAFGRKSRRSYGVAGIWFNFDKDILYLPYKEGLPTIDKHLFNATDIAKVKNVAITFCTEMEWAVETFPKLEELLICLEHGGQPLLEFTKFPRLSSARKQKFKGPRYQHYGFLLRHFPTSMKQLWTTWRVDRLTRGWTRIREPWTFLDGDVSESSQYYMGFGSTRQVLVESVNPTWPPRDRFQIAVRDFELNIHLNMGSAPKLRIGIVVPESASQSLLHNREQYWKDQQSRK